MHVLNRELYLLTLLMVVTYLNLNIVKIITNLDCF